MIPEDLRLTSVDYWRVAGVALVMAIGYVALLARFVTPSRFRGLRWAVVAASALFWIALGLVLFALAWDSFYVHFLPDPSQRSVGRTVLELLIYPPIGLGLWWLASRLPGRPAVTFCVLGGLEALPEHLWGILGLGMLQRVPFLQDVGAASVLAFAVCEYVLYWGTVLSLALLLEAVWGRLRSRGGSSACEETASRAIGVRRERAQSESPESDPAGRGAGCRADRA